MQIFKSIKYQSSTVVETEILPIAQMSLFDILTAWFIWKKDYMLFVFSYALS